jgi:hypothetical protein
MDRRRQTIRRTEDTAMTKRRATHYRNPATNDTYCGRYIVDVAMTNNVDNIDCRSCLNRMATLGDAPACGDVPCSLSKPKRRTPKPRKTALSRHDRRLLGTRKNRRMGTKTKQNRHEPLNYHYQEKPAVIFAARMP